jgi:hypothetical protein
MHACYGKSVSVGDVLFIQNCTIYYSKEEPARLALHVVGVGMCC